MRRSLRQQTGIAPSKPAQTPPPILAAYHSAGPLLSPLHAADELLNQVRVGTSESWRWLGLFTLQSQVHTRLQNYPSDWAKSQFYKAATPGALGKPLLTAPKGDETFAVAVASSSSSSTSSALGLQSPKLHCVRARSRKRTGRPWESLKSLDSPIQ